MRVTVHAEKRRRRRDVARVRQVAYVVRRNDKLAALVPDPRRRGPDLGARVRPDPRRGRRPGRSASSARGHDAGALHGGLSQEQRDRIMGRFRDGALDVLVATDVAARGLDIEHVSHVVNYDVPSNPDEYVHRIGRTGRAGREGVAITLVEPREHRLLRNIEAATRPKLEIAHLPTVADLRERRAESCARTCARRSWATASTATAAVVEPLTDEFDLVDIALAADQPHRGRVRGRRRRDRTLLSALPLPARPLRPMTRPGPRYPGGPGGPGRVPAVPVRAQSAGRCRDAAGPVRIDPAAAAHGSASSWVAVAQIGLRPGDLVGAITNEAGVPGSAIGAIRIDEQFSLVDVHAAVADVAGAGAARATIRGRKLPVRFDR